MAMVAFCDGCGGSIPVHGVSHTVGEKLYCDPCWSMLFLTKSKKPPPFKTEQPVPTDEPQQTQPFDGPPRRVRRVTRDDKLTLKEHLGLQPVRFSGATTGDIVLSIIIPMYGMVVGLIALFKTEWKRGATMMGVSAGWIVVHTLLGVMTS